LRSLDEPWHGGYVNLACTPSTPSVDHAASVRVGDV
jgi:hypothetical protein